MPELPTESFGRLPNGPRPIAILLATLGAAIALTACGTGSGTGEQSGASGPPQRGGVLTIATPLEPVSLDPAVGAADTGSQHIQTLVFDGLLEIEPGTSKVVPGLASSWQLNRKAETATFHLRRAKFSDGTEVTATDVKFSMERAMDPGVDPSFGETFEGLIESVTAPDPRTVVLHFAKPTPSIFPYLTMATLSVISKQAFDRLGAKKFASSPIGGGSGPFKVVKWVKGQYVELARNPYYWKKGRPYLAGIKSIYVPDDNTRILDVKSGQVDAADEVPYSQLKSLEADPELKLLISPLAATSTVFFHANPPLDKPEVRQALNYATPKEVIKKVAFAGQGAIANSVIPPLKYWDSSLKPYPYDIAKAKQLMKQAGVGDGFSLELLTQGGDETSRQEAAILQNSWSKIGVKLSIRTLDPTSLATEFGTSNGSALATLSPPAAASSDIPTEDEFAINFTSPYFEENVFDFSDPQLSRLVGTIEGTWNEGVRTRGFREFQEQQLANPPGVPIVVASARTALLKKVEDFQYSELGRWNLTDTWLAP